MGRIDDLRLLREQTLERISACVSDQNHAILGRLLLDVDKQIDELEGPAAREETPLDEFTRRLSERQSKATRSRRSAAR